MPTWTVPLYSLVGPVLLFLVWPALVRGRPVGERRQVRIATPRALCAWGTARCTISMYLCAARCCQGSMCLCALTWRGRGCGESFPSPCPHGTPHTVHAALVRGLPVWPGVHDDSRPGCTGHRAGPTDRGRWASTRGPQVQYQPHRSHPCTSRPAPFPAPSSSPACPPRLRSCARPSSWPTCCASR